MTMYYSDHPVWADAHTIYYIAGFIVDTRMHGTIMYMPILKMQTCSTYTPQTW